MEQLRDYEIVQLRKVLIIPLFACGQSCGLFLDNGDPGNSPPTQKRITLSDGRLESSGSMTSIGGWAAHYLVFTLERQRLKRSHFLTDTDLKFKPGWNIVYDVPQIVGTKMRSSKYVPMRAKLWDAPEGYWVPSVRVLPD
jgi:hypothetical protein